MYATIIADAREREGANPYLEAAVAAVNRTRLEPCAGGNPIEYLIQTITVGDYAILIRNGKTGQQVPVLIIERKTWKDLAASIKDRRAKVQHDRMVRMQQQTHCRFLYLIEGVWKYSDDSKVQNIPFLNLHAKIRHNTLRGIPFMQSRDQIHSAALIVKLARDMLKMVASREIIIPGLHDAAQVGQEYEAALRNLRAKYVGVGLATMTVIEEQVLGETIVAHPGSAVAIEAPVADQETATDDQAEPKGSSDAGSGEGANVKPSSSPNSSPSPDENIPPASPACPSTCPPTTDELERAIEDAQSQKPIDVPDVLTKRNVASDADVIERMWCSLPGVGDKLAQALRTQHKIRDILTIEFDQRTEWAAKLAKVTFPNGSRLGKPRAERILEVSSTDSSPTAMAKVRDISRKILEAIPGVSSSVAQLILNRHSLRQICQGDVTAAQIAEIQRGGAKNMRLGPALANRIVKYMTM